MTSVYTSLSDRTLNYTPALEFNKSGFANVYITDANQCDVLIKVPVTLKPGYLVFNSGFEKWTFQATPTAEAAADLQKWYKDFQLYFEHQYNVPVEFRPLSVQPMFCNWPRTFVNKQVAHGEIFFNNETKLYGPGALIAEPKMVTATKAFVVVMPTVWVRTETGRNTAGVSLTLKHVYAI